jgi:cell wall-associated NlpC family hydrolase
VSFTLRRRLTTVVLASSIAIGGSLAVAAAPAQAVPAPVAAVHAVPVSTTITTAAPAATAALRIQAAAETAERARFNVARAVHAVHIAQIRVKVVKLARKQVGDRYSAGRSGPNAFDCSGLVRYVYKNVLGKELPHYSGAQYRISKKVSRKNARPGDLVFFLRNGAHHVGIYIGHGHMIDAAGYGEGVRVSPISGSWWSRTYSGMGRLIPA